MQEIYKNYEDWYQNDFHVEHKHYVNRLLHFIGINLFYFFLFVALITLSWRVLLISLLSFPIFSAIGHKIVEKN